MGSLRQRQSHQVSVTPQRRHGSRTEASTPPEFNKYPWLPPPDDRRYPAVCHPTACDRAWFKQVPEEKGTQAIQAADGASRTLFISYRVIYGAERVLIDHERLEGGAVWPEQLEAEEQQASVMLVLIGDGWLRHRTLSELRSRGIAALDKVETVLSLSLDRSMTAHPVLTLGWRARALNLHRLSICPCKKVLLPWWRSSLTSQRISIAGCGLRPIGRGREVVDHRARTSLARKLSRLAELTRKLDALPDGGQVMLTPTIPDVSGPVFGADQP